MGLRGLIIYVVILNGLLTTTSSSSLEPTEDPEIERARERLSSTCDHDSLTTYLTWVARRYSEVARLVPIGNSTEGRELWTMIISSDPQNRALLKPQVKFVGNINGYSGPSCVILVKFITFLVENYDTDEGVRQMLHQTEIHILPSMNPDGYNRSVPGLCALNSRRRYFRGNANGIDLNRNFPDLFHPVDDDEDDPFPEAETLAVIEWMKRNTFAVSASFWSGAQVVTYPYDSAPSSHPSNTPHETPDTKTFEYLARNYVEFVNEDPTSHWFCYGSKWNFPEGVANGALLGTVSGTMMDYNYNNGVFELFIAVDCCLNDNNGTELERIWRRHKFAMIAMVKQAEFSFRGQVVDSETGRPMEGVEIVVIPPEEESGDQDSAYVPMPIFTNERGEFFRVLLPGKYFLKLFYRNYIQQTLPIEIPGSEDEFPEPLRVTMVSETRNRRLRLQPGPALSPVPSAPAVGMTAHFPAHAHHYDTEKHKATENVITVERTELDIHEEIRNFNLVVANPRFNNLTRQSDGIFHELEGYSRPLISDRRNNNNGGERSARGLNCACVAAMLVFLKSLVMP